MNLKSNTRPLGKEMDERHKLVACRGNPRARRQRSCSPVRDQGFASQQSAQERKLPPRGTRKEVC